jgi:phage host-nuclease inhibitor protein Gam
MMMADSYVVQITEYHANMQKVLDEAEKQINDIQSVAAAQAQVSADQIELLFNAVHKFATDNRTELTTDGSKTIKLPAGNLSWRFTPPAVMLEGVDEIIKRIKRMRGGKKFLHIKVTVNKEALLANPKKARKIPGVTIDNREEFSLTINRIKGFEMTHPRRKKAVEKKGSAKSDASAQYDE